MHPPVRYLILSDIHGNDVALQAVMQAAQGEYDAIVCCGDMVGYGPSPNEVVDFCSERCASVVRGNHDKACIGLLDLDWFNDTARISAEWTSSTLTLRNAQWLRDLPQGPLPCDDFELMHGSPRDEDEYLINAGEVEEVAETWWSQLGFFGHTHIQGGFELHRNGVQRLRFEEIHVVETSGFLVNPGSVGQPRDGDPRAAWAIYDADAKLVRLHRTAYDVSVVEAKIRSCGLPEVLGMRLHLGM